MAVKSTGTETRPAAAAKSDQAGPAEERDPRACVVDDVRHVGLAVPGTVVCSYHTMHYAADGSRRR